MLRQVIAAGLAAGISGALAAGCAASTPAAARTPPSAVLDVVGDSYSGGSDEGGVGPAGWPALVAAHNGWTLHNRSAGGSGYTTALTGSTTFVERTAQVVADRPDIVIVWAARNDIGLRPPPAIAAAETVTLTALRRGLPQAQLVVVGPAWTTGSAPEPFLAVRDAERQAARMVGAVFLDPLAEGWFAGRYARLIGSDGVHPTDAGHARLAGLIETGLLEHSVPAAPTAHL